MENRIEELRKQRNYTQQALGDLLGVSRQTIISLERGRYNPSLSLAHAIAKVFNLTIEDIFIFKENKHEK